MQNILYKLLTKYNIYRERTIGQALIRKVAECPIQYGLYCGKAREQKIILSLTSYRGRFETIIHTLKSLILQSVKPDKIIVWLDVEEAGELTEEMQKYTQFGVEYRYKEEKIRSHRKYFYALQEFPNDIVITVDDDLIYPSDLVESLLASYMKYPDCVCARRVHKITKKNNKIERYADWFYEYRFETKPSNLLCATGGAGSLYPPKCLPQETFDVDKIMKYCLSADDIWLKFMEVNQGTKVVWTPNRLVNPPIIEGSQVNALNYQNTWNGGNDKCINNLIKLYPHFVESLY